MRRPPASAFSMRMRREQCSRLSRKLLNLGKSQKRQLLFGFDKNFEVLHRNVIILEINEMAAFQKEEQHEIYSKATILLFVRVLK